MQHEPRCFECGVLFVPHRIDGEDTLYADESYYSDDDIGNKICKSCTLKSYDAYQEPSRTTAPIAASKGTNGTCSNFGDRH